MDLNLIIGIVPHVVLKTICSGIRKGGSIEYCGGGGVRSIGDSPVNHME